MNGITRFATGKIVATPGAVEAVDASGEGFGPFLARHCVGDWGEVSASDARANERALASGERLLSVYRTAYGVKIWIITEADRSVTTVLLPEDY
ncbi:MAG TPA: hypothetical protein VGN72_24105 [Tepidisphaeraceae bacterium]|jgi:hypothetical protein|nr:hypothetical protein [Tepidisphaeraceae bacterium]